MGHCLTTHVAVISSQSIHVGQTRTFSHLRPGDNVGCLGRADSISPRVPRPSVGATTQVILDKRLSFTLDAESRGRNTAHCKARNPWIAQGSFRNTGPGECRLSRTYG